MEYFLYEVSRFIKKKNVLEDKCIALKGSQDKKNIETLVAPTVKYTSE